MGVRVLSEISYDLVGNSETISDKDLPLIITGQVQKLDALSKSVEKALEAADTAKKYASSAGGLSAGIFKKKSAIEGLQTSGSNIADAVQAGAEAQKISFEFQTKLAEITKYLFKLGTLNIASNRSVVRELELRLSGASKEKLSQLAKQELILVVRQLKEQEDVMRKQLEMSKIVKSHNEKIIAQEEIDKMHSEQLKLQSEMDRMLDEKIKAQDEVDKMHTEQIRIQVETDKMHAEQIRLQGEMDKILESKILAQEDADKRHTKQIEELNEVLANQEKIISKIQEDLLEKANNKWMKISILFALTSIVLSIISLLN